MMTVKRDAPFFSAEVETRCWNFLMLGRKFLLYDYDSVREIEITQRGID